MNAVEKVCNWVVCNEACRCMATIWAIMGHYPGAPSQGPVFAAWLMVGCRWCVQRVPVHRSSCGDWEIGVQDGGPGGDWGRHAPLHWNSYCVPELAHNTLLFLFLVAFTNKCYPNIEVANYYPVWVEIRDKQTQQGFSLSNICIIFM